MSTSPWQFAIDVGGTFTDCVARRPDGSITTHKLLSSGVYRVGVAPAAGRRLRLVTDVATSAPPFPSGWLTGFRLTLRQSATAKAEPYSAIIRRHAGTELELDSEAPAFTTATAELASGEPAPVTGIRWLMGKGLEEAVGPVSVRLGTTRGTNALLTRSGARVAFVTTAGFGDVLEIGYQNRPHLFDLAIKKPAPLYTAVVEAVERLDAHGHVLAALDEKMLSARLAAIRAQGIDAVAIAFLHAHLNDVHERRAQAVAEALGFAQISLSSVVSPLQRLVPRAETAVVDAYLTPVIRTYVEDVRRAMPEADLRLMTSAGGLVAAAAFAGKDSILSGPAGGVVGVARVAAEAATARKDGGATDGAVIGFDMGGTSTDVCRFAGDFERRYEMELVSADGSAGLKLAAPMLAVETVAAGGGSICGFDGTRLTVGPASAGAEPGPACYGKGGPLTLTDVNLLLGRLPEDGFALPLVRSEAAARLAEIVTAVQAAARQGPGQRQHYTATAIAEGFLAVAASTMAEPVKKVSQARGYDVREHMLVSFGGAGAQHACRVAEELGIRRIVQHPYASYLSAYGIGMADGRRQAARDVHGPLDAATLARAEAALALMRQELEDAMAREGGALGPRSLQAVYQLGLRYVGQDHELILAVQAGALSVAGCHELFVEAHRRAYGFDFPERSVEVRSARVELVAPAAPPLAAAVPAPPHAAVPAATATAWFQGTARPTARFALADLSPGATLDGPALITGADTVVVVEPGWVGRLDGRRLLVLSRGASTATATATATSTSGKDDLAWDPVKLSLFQNQITGIAEQMGAALRRAALSVNVKERLDFSCAVFAKDGDLVVNAPHIPVHLGSMGETVRAVVADAGATLAPGDVFVTNDPYRGGSHLPDVTVVAPVFTADGQRLLFFVANRAHHAEIGGLTPGSMPPRATSLAEEGVLIRNFRLVAAGQVREAELRQLLCSGPYPSRAPDDNLADIRAQVAANELGRRRLLELVDGSSEAYVAAYMAHLREAAGRRMRQALARVPPGRYSRTDQMDDGTTVAVTVTVSGGEGLGAPSLVCDFSGTGPVAAGNLNANRAIVKAAVLYACRCLIAADVPLNDGLLGPVTLVIPSPSLLSPPGGDDPGQLAAVNAGNVETSQRLVDVLLGALGLAAASQGTMNNLLFGRAPSATAPGFGYYETICGGAGAGPTFAGASAVHTHMTNTRITDAEVLEERYPVRLRRFGLRRGSGGKGTYTGGDGVIRELEFLAPLTLSLITSRRLTVPFGLTGGEPGLAGINRLRRLGHVGDAGELLPATAEVAVCRGDVLIIETPGGAGYGVPPVLR